jgi:choline dehydrogenase/5-(hydroxymethyl)furfural/furfural oxidase
MSATDTDSSVEYSHIIIGAGSAGCVLADGLSRDPNNQVLIIEAGPAYRSIGTPDDVATVNNSRVLANPALTWPLHAQLSAAQQLAPYQQGRGVGGSSAINNCWALRARPGDLTRWAAAGVTTITWEALEQHYRDIETDLDYPTRPIHGAAGPVPISRLPEGRWPAVDAALREAAAAAGLPWSDDLNSPTADGAGTIPMTARDSRRVSAHDAFLDPALDRPNLHLLPDTHVDTILLDGTHATGVSCGGRTSTTFRATTVIASAGALQSPLLLLRSGIGPADELARAGVTPVVDLPGVGANLTEHPLVPLVLAIKPEAQNPSVEARQCNVLIRPNGGTGGDTWHIACMSLSPMGPSHAIGFASLMQPSSRGRVTLVGEASAAVQMNCLATDSDADQLWEGVTLLTELMQSRQIKAITDGPLMSLSGVFDPTVEVAARRALLRRTCQPYRHLSGTCVMSDDEATTAVVTSDHRVRGTDNLYIVDASTLPDSTSSNLNLTVVAIADRAAQLLSAEPPRSA